MSPNPNDGPSPPRPAGGTTHAVTGGPVPPTGTAGAYVASNGDMIWTMLNLGAEIKNTKSTLTHGPVLKIINGDKHKHIIAVDEVVHIGGSFQEVIGIDSKLTLGGDRRWIMSTRWERNIFLKAETITGDYNSHTGAGEDQDVAINTAEMSPTVFEQKAKEHEELSTKVIEKFKGRLADHRKNLAVQISAARYQFKDWTRDHKQYMARIDQWRQNFGTYNGKLTRLKEEVKKYEVTTAKFFKIISSAGIKLEAAKFDGNAKSKWKYVAKALAEFKGDIKLGG